MLLDWLSQQGTLAQEWAANPDLIAITAGLNEAARLIRTAETYTQRQEANTVLRGYQAQLSEQMGVLQMGGQPTMHQVALGGLVTVLNREIASTAVSYTTEQQEMVNTNKDPLKVDEAAILPTPDVRGIDQNQQKAAAELMSESRKIVAHPYENDWWETTVLQCMQDNSSQIITEIKARNAGYPRMRDRFI